MFNGLVEEIEAIKKCLFEDLKVTNKSKEKALHHKRNYAMKALQ